LFEFVPKTKEKTSIESAAVCANFHWDFHRNPGRAEGHRNAMISRISYYGSLLGILVYSLPLFAFAGAAYCRFGNVWLPGVHTVTAQFYLVLLVFTEIVWLLAAHHYKLASLTNLFQEYTGSRTAFRACLVTLLLQAVFLLFAREVIVSRIFILLVSAILFCCVVAARSIVRRTSGSATSPRKSAQILVVGTDQYAQRSVDILRRIPFLRCEIRAYVQLPGQPIRVQDAPVIATHELNRVESLTFDEVVVAIPSEGYLQVSSVLDSLQNFGKPIRAILDLGPRLSLREKVFQVGRLQMMNLAISPVESFAYTVLKRTFDLVAASLGVVILSPVLLVLAVLTKLSSPGPVFFRQERVGRDGKFFMLLKFRTMHCSSSAESDTIWTIKNDPRCTRIGAILRRYCLDELPQLFNVIRGEMSLVGPRPERPYFVKKFRTNIQKYNLRHCCQVGMTGWAQVHGLRGDTSIPDRLQYDLHYIHNWSFSLDLHILARTMFTALKNENEY
jgi:exopolysaccharide biosynthesis polyprenyl glycosylphosphotransferase